MTHPLIGKQVLCMPFDRLDEEHVGKVTDISHSGDRVEIALPKPKSDWDAPIKWWVHANRIHIIETTPLAEWLAEQEKTNG